MLAGVWKDLAVVCDIGFEDIDDEIGVISTLGELVSDLPPDVLTNQKASLSTTHLRRCDAVRSVRVDLFAAGVGLCLPRLADGRHLLRVRVVVRERLIDGREVEVIVRSGRLRCVADFLDTVAELERRDSPPLDVWLIEERLRDARRLYCHTVSM